MVTLIFTRDQGVKPHCIKLLFPRLAFSVHPVLSPTSTSEIAKGKEHVGVGFVLLSPVTVHFWVIQLLSQEKQKSPAQTPGKVSFFKLVEMLR